MTPGGEEPTPITSGGEEPTPITMGGEEPTPITPGGEEPTTVSPGGEEPTPLTPGGESPVPIVEGEEAVGLPERQGLRRAHGRRPRKEALRMRPLRGSISQEGMGLVRPDSPSMPSSYSPWQ